MPNRPVLLPLLKRTGAWDTTRPGSDWVAPNGDRPRALPHVKEGAQAPDALPELVETEPVRLQREAVNREAFEIHPASIPESKADRYSRASKWS